MPIPPSTVLSCLCRQISIPLTTLLPTSPEPSLPLWTELCHCNTCRLTTGALSGAFFELGTPTSLGHSAISLLESTVRDKCSEYKSSEKVSRYFCNTCGSHILLKGWTTTEPVFWFGWLGDVDFGTEASRDRETIDVGSMDMHAYVDDTLDGGLVGRIVDVAVQSKAGIEGCKTLETVYADIFEGPVMTKQELESLVEQQKSSKDSVRKAEKLLAECHCGGVRFWITRPRPGWAEDFGEKVKYYLKDGDTRYLGKLCACRSCRSATGHPLQPWTYVPPEAILTDQLEQIEFGDGENSLSQVGATIKKYKGGDKDVIRSFCGTCGATVFYENLQRQWVVDVSIGILRSQAGSLAEDFIEWDWENASWQDERTTRQLLKDITGKA